MGNLLGCIQVDQSTVAIKERFGKFDDVLEPGCHCLPWCLGSQLAGHLTLRLQQLNVRCETKTKDNVFVNVVASIQYRAIADKASDAFYKLSNTKGQIQAYVFDVIRASVPNMNLDDAFEQKNDIAKAVKDDLEKAMSAYGYEIVQTLIVDIEPDEHVKRAMNEINAAVSMSMDDKISQLPQHILHHILCFLPQKNAVQTSVLSKSWRYLGSTRPKVEFCVQELEETHPYVLNEILQRYHDHKLSIHQFIVKINSIDRRTFSLLEKWVPIVVTNMGAKKFKLNLRCIREMNPPDPIFVLPSAVFQAAEFLEELYLRWCILSRIEPTDKLLLKRLRKVSLIRVYIEDETFEKIISSCPLIEYLVMDWCMGLKTIHLNNNNNLKHFEFHPDFTNKNCSIEIAHVPSVETIRVHSCPNWFYHRRLCFAHLKSLHLTSVCLSTTNSFDIFSSNFPVLENLTLNHCYGFQEFKLSSRSIKRIVITMNQREAIKATIDAPNILYFSYIHSPQSSISFAASCSHEWKSYIHLYNFLGDADSSDDRGGSYSWLYKISKLVKAFSQSKISVHLHQHSQDRNLRETMLLDNSTYTELVVVEQLILDTSYSSLSIAALTKCLLRIFRPKYIVEYHGLGKYEHVESLSKIRGRGTQFWPQDLEDMIMEDIDLDESEWKPVKIGFRLKWKET